MGIGRLQICDWSNLQKRDTEIPFPKWTQVEEAIRALNNNNLNDLYLIPQLYNARRFDVDVAPLPTLLRAEAEAAALPAFAAAYPDAQSDAVRAP